MENIILNIIVAICISLFITNLIAIAIKLHLFRSKAIVNEHATISFSFNIWAAAVLGIVISYYFLAV